MKVLHEHREVLHGVMDIFLREPLLDWRQEMMPTRRAKLGYPLQKGVITDATLSCTTINDESNEDAGANQGIIDIEARHIRLKVTYAQRKLSLHNPTAVMLAELKARHSGQRHYKGLEQVVMGEPNYNQRAQCSATCGSVEQQVDLLLDQATDPNILAKTWQGWSPWI